MQRLMYRAGLTRPSDGTPPPGTRIRRPFLNDHANCRWSNLLCEASRLGGCESGSFETTCSVNTLKRTSFVGPNAVEIATSAASLPRAMTMRPMRGWLCRASKVYQLPPIYASNHALKSIGAGSRGTPISPRNPVQYLAGMFMHLQSVTARCAKSRHTPLRSS